MEMFVNLEYLSNFQMIDEFGQYIVKNMQVKYSILVFTRNTMHPKAVSGNHTLFKKINFLNMKEPLRASLKELAGV
jgi:hypothetical protein